MVCLLLPQTAIPTVALRQVKGTFFLKALWGGSRLTEKGDTSPLVEQSNDVIVGAI